MKLDPHKNKEGYFNWKEKIKQKGISGISKQNSYWIMRFMENMECGINISSSNVKGPRSYARLNTLRQKLIFLSKKFKKILGIDDITQISEEQLYRFFSDMRRGIIKKDNGGNYKSVADFVKIFKTFWHWYQKISKKQGKEILDITADLDTSSEKPKWVYLTEEQVKELYNHAKYEYKVIILFLFDTGIRAPSELINIKVSDLYNDCKELNIRDEISKTFGRRIKLMLCSDILKEFISKNNLQPEDYLFQINHILVNRYIKRLSERIFGDKLSPAGQKYSELTMYDFRHISCCYWLPRYKSESALKFRFGWKKSDKIHYYSELLGMRDTIREEDLLVDVTKTEIEKRLNKSETEKEMLKERVHVLENQMKKILQLMNQTCFIVKEN